jgi:hypothetical protein
MLHELGFFQKINTNLKKYWVLFLVSTISSYIWYCIDVIEQINLCTNGQTFPEFPIVPLISFTISFFILFYTKIIK